MRYSVLPLLVVLAACGDDAPTAPSPASIQNITWKLETIERAGVPTISISNPDAYTVAFQSDGRLDVRADCNTCNGRYSLSGSTVATSGLACTRAFCGTTIDTVFTSALAEARTYSREGSRLIVQGQGLTLRFRS